MQIRNAAVVAAALAGVAASAAEAAALRVSPVGFQLPSDQRSATLSVQDEGDAPMNVQVRVFRWSQEDGEDRLATTDDLITSPPFASLEPSAEQTVRLVRTAPAAGPTMQETAFRILVDELPPTGDAGGATVRLLLRHSVPVFVEPTTPVRAEVSWSAQAGVNSVQLRATNTGGRHLRLANLQVLDAGGRILARQDGLVGYVLAGATMRFGVPRAQASATNSQPVRIQADTDAGRIDAAVALRP